MTTADDFLQVKHLFQLGDLPTESPHPATTELSALANSDLPAALELLRRVDLEALRTVASLRGELAPLFTAVGQTLAAGDRVFLAGCGATGRLSLSLEFLWRRRHPKSEQVISFMAGGDVALVHSLEGFEDFPALGARHLRELGFTSSDLLIGITEGGETPYVIGAVEEAAATSTRRPLFLFCNPREILERKVERSRRVLQDPRILSCCLDTGPMALTGSTRMQASTVLMLAAGLALEHAGQLDPALDQLERWINFIAASPSAPLAPLIEREADTYQEGAFTCYTADEFAITVFNDTTERAPTFNLPPFDNPAYPAPRHSLSYLSIPPVETAREAWHHLLGREPRPTHWPEIHAKTSEEYLYAFDFSRRALDFRRGLIPVAAHHPFDIAREGGTGQVVLRFRELEERWDLPGPALGLGIGGGAGSELLDHLTLKMLLNMHSTLVMGRLGRYEGNLMTWLYPSNGKLVDRAARYTQILLKRRALPEFNYEEIVRAQYTAKTALNSGESIVEKTVGVLVATSDNAF